MNILRSRHLVGAASLDMFPGTDPTNLIGRDRGSYVTYAAVTHCA